MPISKKDSLSEVEMPETAKDYRRPESIKQPIKFAPT